TVVRGRGPVLTDVNAPADAMHITVNFLAQLCMSVLSATLLTGLMVYLSWPVTLVIGALGFGTVYGWRRFADPRSIRYGHRLYDIRAELSALEVDAIDGLRVVKAYGLASHLVRQHRDLLGGQVHPELRLAFFRAAPQLVNDAVAIAIVLVLGGVTLLMPHIGLTFPTLVAFLLAIRRVSPAVAGISTAAIHISQARRGIERIDEVVHGTPQEPAGGRTPATIERVELANVSFRYTADPQGFLLDGVTVAMPRS